MKCPFDEKTIGQNVPSTKWSFDESVRTHNLCVQKIAEHNKTVPEVDQFLKIRRDDPHLHFWRKSTIMETLV